MAESRFDAEVDLIRAIKQSRVYKEFVSKFLTPKKEREKEAWRLLTKHGGRYTVDH